MVGKKIEKDSETGKNVVVDYAYGSFTTAYEAGSVVKAATLLTGYKLGAISPSTVLGDEPIHLLGTPVKNRSLTMVGIFQWTA